jgi:DNA-binding NtrC family response regulator
VSEIPIRPRERILVVDDDPSILRLVTTILRRANYDVDTAVNGRVALEKISATEYAAVVLDLMMPEVSGLDVLAGLQSRDRQPGFVVIMSAASPDLIADAVNRNVFAALRKPFEIEELVETVRACIASPKAIQDDPRGVARH